MILLFSLFWGAIPQDAPAPNLLAADVIARVNEHEIQRKDYLEYLYVRFGKRGIHELATDWLVQEEAKRYQILVSDSLLRERVARREAEQKRDLSEEDFEKGLQQNGQDLSLFRTGLQREVTQQILLEQLVLKTRLATDDKIKRAFHFAYGPEGNKVHVQHILIMPNVLRAELIRQGRKPADIQGKELQELAEGKANEVFQELQNGMGFSVMAKEFSHDRVSREKSGDLPHYNGRLYGPAFGTAVKALQPGEFSDVFKTGAGFHIVKLVARTTTLLENVRGTLIQEILAAPASMQEIQAYRTALLEDAKLQLW
jgi:parvulin-like peptidyl-prolyl isomerase